MLSSAPPSSTAASIPFVPASSSMEGFGLGPTKDEDDFDMQFDETEEIPPPPPANASAGPSHATLARLAHEEAGSSSGEEEVLEEGTF
jgi:hypothetical protein